MAIILNLLISALAVAIAWEIRLSETRVGVIFCNTFAAKDGSVSFDFTAGYDRVEPMKRLSYTIGEMGGIFPSGRPGSRSRFRRNDRRDTVYGDFRRGRRPLP